MHLFSLLDSIFHLLIVWYYCTLTIRERILMQNGSRIKGWWATYHFILTVEAAVMLIWYVAFFVTFPLKDLHHHHAFVMFCRPSSRSYSEFRDQFMFYSFYIRKFCLVSTAMTWDYRNSLIITCVFGSSYCSMYAILLSNGLSLQAESPRSAAFYGYYSWWVGYLSRYSKWLN